MSEITTLRVGLVDAFTEEPLSGNAAGVVPDAEGLSEAQMAAVAREINASETAFFLPSGTADRRVRYFTPTTEVDRCGHATVGGVAFLRKEGLLDAGTHVVETNAGDLPVEIEDDGTVWMTQGAPEVREVGLDRERVREALGLDAGSLIDELPVARASTGLPFLVVPVTYLSALGNAEPDPDAVEALAEEADAVGVYAFTFDTLSAEATLHGRAWAPTIGIAEDPVTGTASGAVGGYLRYAGAFDAMPEEMALEQGHYLDRPGEVRVRVGDPGDPVRVGGRATVALEGTLRVPEGEDDDVIVA